MMLASSGGPVHGTMPLHRSIVAVDIEQSTERSNKIKAELRAAIYRLVGEAMTYAGIETRHCDPFADRGDGVLMLIRPTDEVPKTFLLSRMVPELARLLVDYNLRLPTNAWGQRGIRLRVVVHAGEVHNDGVGYFGEALDVAFRLLDAPQLKRRLRKEAAPMALVVSEDIYRGVVMHQYDRIDPSAYNPEIRVQVAGHRHLGYVHIPADAFESLTVDSATGAIVPPATSFFNQLERYLIQAEQPFDVERGLADLSHRLPVDEYLGGRQRQGQVIGEHGPGLADR